MKILVTGGAGFIGSHTCVALLEAGYDIVVLDNLCNAKPAALERIRQITGKDFPFYQADILDRAGVGQAFREHDIGAVIHFAGLKAVGESVKNPLLYYHNNVAGTVAFCQIMAEAGCKKIVFSSSATVYGPTNPIPYREEFPTSATNPYGYTKLMVEQILSDLYRADNEWSVSLLRYFNPIGAHESGLIGEDPNGIPNNLLPYICQVAVGKLEKLHVYGNDYDTVDGTGVRDYVHVCDLAEGHLQALEYVLGHTGVDAVNLGTGKGCSVLEVVAAYERASGRRIPYVIDPRRPGDLGEYYADASKAQRVFGWKAKRGLDEMCRDSWNFTKKNPAGL
ncbi:UDP-glucose 4-epimerase GalE [Zongyangia hominis]|uniref:UDP-glucose 4-epimerase n=1 Tax=Zongyangia hominis TaxID=2763677 RepID=A0A926EFV4_9FIRM|nr:UDP-glucose 4-epimerase GalE [Zongyangia hominis]MBC8571076.1 UDP-glucose 4-epimerase GalE [Zongyangia hominis]